MSKITIAIDGYSSCGKSTIAKALASKLGYNYVDTGAMYRAATLYCLRKEIIINGSFNKRDVIELLNNINLTFIHNPHTKTTDTYLNGECVEKEIRQMLVSDTVSKISAIREVRDKMSKIQRELGKDKGVVMDGRDIGTSIFPDAELKIFMIADEKVRVQRRLDEFNSKGHHTTFEEVQKSLNQRDFEDTHRKENPLRKAGDAILLDNTELTKEQQLEFVIKLINDLLLTKD